jgi:D-arginine utilization repressor
MARTEELLKPYQPFIDAIVELFDPLVEVAVHDLQEGKILAIYNPFSHRKVGEKSPLKDLKVDIDKFPDHFAPYTRRNWDGKELKCTSITVRNPAGKPVALICLNIDTSVFVQTRGLLESFLKIKPKAEGPIEVYGIGCDKQVGALIEHFMKEHQLTQDMLDRSSKKELIEFLYRKGAFNYKSAVPFVAKRLKLSRASIYNYIKESGGPCQQEDQDG